MGTIKQRELAEGLISRMGKPRLGEKEGSGVPEQQFLGLKLIITGTIGRELTELEDARIDVQIIAIIKEEIKSIKP